uniref:Uncharacterized protein n=1 Tax=Daphnia galeata TaxID=27404 RepID=A0A8J2WHB3_9CRUS|nr:unnamed protein product [Daphnia galeata]
MLLNWTGGDAVKVVVSTGSPDFSGGQESSEYSVGFVIVRMCVTEMPKRVIKTRSYLERKDTRQADGMFSSDRLRHLLRYSWIDGRREKESTRMNTTSDSDRSTCPSVSSISNADNGSKSNFKI